MSRLVCPFCGHEHQCSAPELRPSQWRITVHTMYGSLLPQALQADNVKQLLLRAATLPITRWFPPAEEDEHE